MVESGRLLTCYMGKTVSWVQIPPSPPRKKFAKQILTWLERLNLFYKFITFRKNMYYVYILKSLRNKSLYIGYTVDLKKRLEEHNDGKNISTKPLRPYKLIFYEAFLEKIDAKNREEYLKSGYGRKTINKLLRKYLSQK